MMYSKVGDEHAKVFQASSQTRRVPGGIKETRRSLKDSESGIEKMAIGHHIHDRAHVIAQSQNKKTGDQERNEEFLNLDETEAQSFEEEWQKGVSKFKPSVPLSHLEAPKHRTVHRAAITKPDDTARRFQAISDTKKPHIAKMHVLKAGLHLGRRHLKSTCPLTLMKDMDLNTSMFMQLYAWYSWPNVVLCFLGGFLLDRVFGIRIGGESLAVAQNTYAVSWFKGKELNLVFGLQLSMARLGSTVNMNIMGWIYSSVKGLVGSPGHTTLGITLLIGEVIKLTDVKDFSISLWLIFLICVCYYVAVFPFIGLGQVFFIEKFSFSVEQARAINRYSNDSLKILDKSEVIKLTDVKDFSISLWLIFIICVCYYVAVFPFIGLGHMQSIQNLGLALISIASGYILDNHGYLFLEVFFSACVCCKYEQSIAIAFALLIFIWACKRDLQQVRLKYGLVLMASV
ncbi:UNVERIFIED_CONTAM: hypothetical protein FKN15_001464 [Acipenser sinensis]